MTILRSSYPGLRPQIRGETLNSPPFLKRESEIFIGNLLVRVHLLVDRPCATGFLIPLSRKPYIFLPSSFPLVTFWGGGGVGGASVAPYTRTPLHFPVPSPHPPPLPYSHIRPILATTTSSPQSARRTVRLAALPHMVSRPRRQLPPSSPRPSKACTAPPQKKEPGPGAYPRILAHELSSET